MIKYFLLLIALLPNVALSDYFDRNYVSLDDYDKDTGQYFTFVSEDVEEKGFISSSSKNAHKNIFIYNPSKKTGRNVFSKDVGEVSSILIESSYSAKNENFDLMVSNLSVKNNNGISFRKPHSSFLIETYNQQDKLFTVWQASKMNGSPTVIFSYKKPGYWHVDINQQVIRYFSPSKGTIQVTEYSW
jgi:hypothetical protein